MCGKENIVSIFLADIKLHSQIFLCIDSIKHKHTEQASLTSAHLLLYYFLIEWIMSTLGQTRRSISISDPSCHNTVACPNSATSARGADRLISDNQIVEYPHSKHNERTQIKSCCSETPCLTLTGEEFEQTAVFGFMWVQSLFITDRES